MKRVLIIDDSELQVSIIENALEDQENLHTTSFVNSSKAVQELKQNINYDIILLDLHMPEFDGICILKLLEKLHFKGGIILISGMGRKLLKVARKLSTTRKLHLLGALPKPVAREELLALMQRTTSLHCATDVNIQPLSKALILEAIERDYILPYFQPQVFITGHVKGFEVLARLDIPQLGIIKPDHFIPQCIEFGLIKPLFQKLLLKSLGSMESINRMHRHYEYSLAINIASSQLQELNFSQWLFNTLSKFDVKPEQLIIEITESQAQESGVNELDNLSRLRMAGIKISIDDFGTGFSNLDKLTDLEFDEVKLDRSFANGVSNEKISQIIVESLVKIVREINAELVVEGIENLKDLNFMHEAGCKIFQGFIFCRPKPINEVMRWLDATIKHAQASA